jgi:hypothetical protein
MAGSTEKFYGESGVQVLILNNSIAFRVKKVPAIVILIVLLFNWVGYQLYLTIAEKTKDQR